MQEEQLKKEAKTEEAKKSSEGEEKPLKSSATGSQVSKTEGGQSKSMEAEPRPAEVEKAAEAERPLVVDDEMMDEDEAKSVESA